jgi:hypothetical protein
VSGVNSSPALKWFVLLLLPLTLAWKLTVRPVDATEPKDRVAEFLIRHQFRIAETKIMIGMPVAVATTPECRMLVGVPSSYGSHRDSVRGLAGATDQAFFVFRGGLYDEQPVWATAFYRLWSKFLREIGVARDITPVFAVIAAPGCDARQLPWNELG